MSQLLDQRSLTATGGSSALRFTRAGGGQWPEWDRYLELDGRRAYHLGNVCDTCEFLFQRLEGANRSVSPAAALAERLQAGLRFAEPEFLDQLGSVVPSGQYSAALLEVRPRLLRPGQDGDYFSHEQIALWGMDAFWGLPHDPRTEYYRAGTTPLAGQRVLYEFVVPMHPHGWLQAETVERHMARLRSGERPTALALSILDVKQPADWEGEREVTEHWCFAHYLLDGHHKMYAAASAGEPITMLALAALQQGVSSEAQVGEALTALRAPAA
jgi:hypothetical protein